jgi:hypothetical protein
VVSTTGFPVSGRIRIDNEFIDYTGTTAGSFTGATRGALSTVAAAHLSGATVDGQNTISSSAPEISIGGGVTSATHFTLAVPGALEDTPGQVNLPGVVDGDVDYVNFQTPISAFIADRFGNFNVLTGTSISFFAEAGAVDSSGVTDATGQTFVIFRTQNPAPADVSTDAWEVSMIDALNLTYSETGNTTSLFAPVDDSVTTIPVLSTSGFPSGGSIRAGSEIMSYTGTTLGPNPTELAISIGTGDATIFVRSITGFPSSGPGPFSSINIGTEVMDYTGTAFGAATTTTALIATFTNSISVASTTGFPPAGRIWVGSEPIDYTGIIASPAAFTGIDQGSFALQHNPGEGVFGPDSFTGVTRGEDSTIAQSHFARDPDTGGDAVNGKSTFNGVTRGTSATTAAGHPIASSVVGFVSVGIPTDGSFHPRDGWVKVLGLVQGEETFADENANGTFERSFSASPCPFGHTCECDGGVTNAWSSSVAGGATCAGGLRSEGFVDQGEPFIDKNDDGDYDDGSSPGEPFEEFVDTASIDTNSDGIPDAKNGVYDTPNGAWDGPECQSDPCLKSKIIWTDITLVFTSNAFYCEVTPLTFEVPNGGVQTFSFMVGDINTNRVEPGTTISVEATNGQAGGFTDFEVADGVSTGPQEIFFTLADNDPTKVELKNSTITVDVETPNVVGCTVFVSGTVE